MANIVPFAILGLVYVLAGASGTAALVVFGIFALARLGHSLAYVAGKQPWRSIFFTIGGVATPVLVGLVVRSIVASRA